MNLPSYPLRIAKILILLFAAYGALLLWEGGTRTRSEAPRPTPSPSGPAYSFEVDDDGDGVSNATEIAVGSDPRRANSDGDDFSDAEELMHGYDPSRTGKTRLEERDKKSDTIHFLVWASARTAKTPDPLKDTSLISAYLKETFRTPTPPAVTPRTITKTAASNLETVTTYLYSMSLVPFPKGVAQYSAIANAIQQTGVSEPLRGVVDEIAAMEKHYETMTVPKASIELHKDYLLLFAELKEVFSDLKYAREDPVRIAKNMLIGQVLVEKASSLERAKAELGARARANRL